MTSFPVGRMKRGTSENPTFHGARATPRRSTELVQPRDVPRSSCNSATFHGLPENLRHHGENPVFNCQIPVVPPSILTYDETRKPSTCGRMTLSPVGRMKRGTSENPTFHGPTAYMYDENFVFNCQIPVVPPSILTYDVTRKPSTCGRMTLSPVGRMKRGTSGNPTFHGFHGPTLYMHNENCVFNCQIPVVPPSILTYGVTRKSSTP